MNQLSDYITERIRIDNVKQVKFPIDGTLEEMSKYLDDLNFDKVEMPDSWRAVQKKFKNVKYSTYTDWKSDSGRASTLVILVDSKIHKKDLFIIITTNIIDRNYLIFYDIENKKFRNINDAVKVSKEEFLEELNKRFGW